MSASAGDEQDRADMARLAAGHDAALEELMGRHAERLYNYLLRVLQNEAEAGDLAEESFVRVYQNRARFRPTHKFSTWLYAIATNLARDLQRHRARHPNVSLEAERGEAGQNFHEVLREEKPNPGEALVLAEYEDRSYVEIAEILECSAKAVEMRLYRARQELREKLARIL
jgi:RNA polymerase sigma-70 factor, ECF subfamily